MGMYTIWRGVMRDTYGIPYKPKNKLWQDPSYNTGRRKSGSKKSGKRRYGWFRSKKGKWYHTAEFKNGRYVGLPAKYQFLKQTTWYRNGRKYNPTRYMGNLRRQYYRNA